MKSKDLIKKLQDLDPTGETEVYVGNCDILYVDLSPSYYDGRAQQFTTWQVYNEYGCSRPIAGKFRAGGEKIQIKAESFEDMAYYNEEMGLPFEVDTSENHKIDAMDYNARLKYERDLYRQIREELTFLFVESWVRKQAVKQHPSVDLRALQDIIESPNLLKFVKHNEEHLSKNVTKLDDILILTFNGHKYVVDLK